MAGYEVAVSITAVCPCCGDDLPSSAYLTVSRPSEGPFDRDNPYERKDRRVFITPCAKCYEPKRNDHQQNAAQGGESSNGR